MENLMGNCETNLSIFVLRAIKAIERIHAAIVNKKLLRCVFCFHEEITATVF